MLTRRATLPFALILGLPLRSVFASDVRLELQEFAERVLRACGVELKSTSPKQIRTEFSERLHSILTELMGDEDWRRLAALSDSTLRSVLRQRIIADYRAGKLELVHGWLLSITEQRALFLEQHLRAMI